MAGRRKIEVIISGDTAALERAFAKSGVAAKGFGRSIGSVSVGALAGVAALTAAADTLRDVFFSSRDAASDLGEAVNKTNVTFGTSAAAVQKFAKTTASSLGISRRAALEAAGGFGVLFDTAGLSERQSAQFSTALVGLAADIASFNNLDPGDALEKLRSGLVGETEPLRAVGVLLSEARVQQEAYSSGIAKAGAKLTEAQKVQARYALILKDTAKQQGDFARTSDQYANSSRIVKAQIENISAGFGRLFLPAITAGSNALAGFLVRLDSAKGARAKFNVAFDSVKDIGSNLITVVRSAIDRIDWDQVLETARREIPKATTRALQLLADGFATVGRTVARVLAAVDWAGVGRFIGDRIVAALQAVTRLLQAVDWQQVGGSLIQGFRRFLAAVPWKQIVTGAFKLAVAAIKGVGSLLLGAGEELGKALLDGIGRGFNSAKDAIYKAALQLALKIVEPFDISVLGVTLVPGIDGVISKLESKLAEMEGVTSASATRINAFLAGIGGDAPKDVNANIGGLQASSLNSLKDFAKKAKDVTKPEPKKPTPTVPVIPKVDIVPVGRPADDRAARVNQFFDNKVSRALDRVQDLPTLRRQLAALKQIADTITRRVEITKDVTRKLKLEDDLVSVNRQIAGTTQQLGDGFLDSLQFGVDAAQATRQLSDDLRAYKALQAGLQQRIRAEGSTLDLQRQLLAATDAVTQTQASIRQRQQAARQARQFRTLGLTDTGADRAPAIAALRKQLGGLDQAIGGTLLDTGKTKSILNRVRTVLKGGLGQVGDDVRTKIKEILDGLDNELKNRSNQPLTKFAKANSDKVLAGVRGLSTEQTRLLRSRISQIGAGGSMSLAAPGVGALGFAIPVRQPTTVIPITVELDGNTVAKTVTKHQATGRARTTGQRGKVRR